jgi:hypothetical protein
LSEIDVAIPKEKVVELAGDRRAYVFACMTETLLSRGLLPRVYIYSRRRNKL